MDKVVINAIRDYLLLFFMGPIGLCEWLVYGNLTCGEYLFFQFIAPFIFAIIMVPLRLFWDWFKRIPTTYIPWVP